MTRELWDCKRGNQMSDPADRAELMGFWGLVQHIEHQTCFFSCEAAT